MARSSRSKKPKSRNQGWPAAVMTLGVLLLLASRGTYLHATIGDMKQDQDVGVEHLKPLTLEWTVGHGGNGHLVDIHHDSDETIIVSVPTAWTLREVRGGTLDRVTGSASTLGFTTWKIPANMTISLWATDPPSFLFHNASTTPLSVHATFVNVHTGKTKENVTLILKKATRVY